MSANSSSATPQSANPAGQERAKPRETTAHVETSSTTGQADEIGQQTVETARRRIAERQEVGELLAALERQVDTVKPRIAERVKADYLRRLDELELELEPVERRLREQARQLLKREQGLRGELDEAEDQLSELDFRLRVGELGSEDLGSASAPLRERCEQLRNQLDQLGASLSELEPFLGQGLGQLREQQTADDPCSSTPVDVEQSAAPTAPLWLPLDPESRPTSGPQTSREDAADGRSKPSFDFVPPARKLNPPAGLAPTQAPAPLPVETGWLLRMPDESGAADSMSYRLDGAVFTIGRARSNNAVVQGASISRLHAVIRWQGDAFVVEDASSVGGIRVNGDVVKRHQLEDGDAIEIESATFLFKDS